MLPEADPEDRRPVDLLELIGLCTFPPQGEELVCAVSGGPDSLALLVLAVTSGCRVTAVHVDHGLREGSSSEAAIVEEAARRFGAAFRAETVKVEPGPNLEARARVARREVLPDAAATGHTMDDQAETVLLNLLRGSGLDGMSAMRRGPRHPLLALRRTQTRALCARLGLKAVDDPMNHEKRFVRNRVRHDLLPLCCEIAGRDIVPVLARQAELLRDEADLLDELSEVLDPSDAKVLASSPKVLARRAMRRWLRTAGHPPDLRAVERVLDVASGRYRATDVAPGLRVRRTRGVLVSGPVERAGRDGVV